MISIRRVVKGVAGFSGMKRGLMAMQLKDFVRERYSCTYVGAGSDGGSPNVLRCMLQVADAGL